MRLVCVTIGVLGKGVKRIRLYGIPPATLDIIMSLIPDAEVTVGIPNSLIPSIATSLNTSLDTVRPLTKYTSIVKYVTVSNKPETDSSLKSQLSTVVLPALNNIVSALQQLGIPAKATVAFTHENMIANSYPVSSSTLNPVFESGIKALLQVSQTRMNETHHLSHI